MNADLAKGIFVLGSNHRVCPVEVREKLSFPSQEIPGVLKRFRSESQLDEVVLLSTCNRTEIYGASLNDPQLIRNHVLSFLEKEKGISKSTLQESHYLHLGESAVSHLFRVTSSLDSMVLGETQILSQVRDAYLLAQQAQTVGPRFDPLFQRAFRAAKIVRTQTKIGQGSVSVASVAVDLARKIFTDLKRRRVLLLGAGEMAELCLKHLLEAGVSGVQIANRTESKASALAQQYGAESVSFETLHEAATVADIVLLCLDTPKPLLSSEDLKSLMPQRQQKALFLIDISVPRSVDAEAGQLDNVYLYNIDDLQKIVEGNRAQRQAEIESSLSLISVELEKLEADQARSEMDPLLTDLQRHVHGIREEEEKKLFQKLSTQLDPAAVEEIRSSMRRVVNRILYPSTKAIKRDASTLGKDKLTDMTRDFFGLDSDKPSEK